MPIDNTVYECWVSNTPGSFQKFTSAIDAVVWFSHMLKNVENKLDETGEHHVISIGVHKASEYSQ
jgi:hypothetical protein